MLNFSVLNTLAFPFGSGFTLQSFLKQKRISTSIPNAGSGVAKPRIYLHPPNPNTGTACAVAHITKPTLHCTCSVAVIFNCHTFCSYAAKPFGTLPIPLRSIVKEPSQHTAYLQKDGLPQSPFAALMPV